MKSFTRLRAAAALAVFAVVLYAGFRPIGPLPPLGPLLDPLTGVWAVGAQDEFPDDAVLAVPGAADTIRVYVDGRAVPHIFATSIDDVWRALGYLHARHRLFQLELQVRGTDGTLAELIGARVLSLDRFNRRLGIPRAAERELADLDSTSRAARALFAYAEGVNARIAELTRRDLPLEYRLLDAWPRRWEVLHSLVFIKRMGYTLSYSRLDRRVARLAELIGEEAALALAPAESPIQEPIVPAERNAPRMVATPLPAPVYGADRNGESPPVGRSPAPDARGLASNNWVVAPSRAQAGRALLAGDPHLDLTLPSIWYEAHLVVPGELDVHGVTFPGVPGVPIGFNRRVAWSFTNTGNDVVDFYREVLDDPAAPEAYRLDGAWRRLDRRVEVYRGQDGEVLATDTVWFTHRGPLVETGDNALSMRWAVLEGQGAIAAFQGMLTATTADEWLEAMHVYRAPVQNGAVADWLGTVAIASFGRYPVRPGDGSGLRIRDGATSASDWTGDLPPERQPIVRNPAQGFAASANQQPVDPAVDPTYLGANWPSPWRAMRINALLRADTSITPDAMRRFQTDPGSARADLLVPVFLDGVAAWQDGPDDVVRRAHEAAGLLREWDRRYTPDSERAALFEEAMDELERRTWDELAAGPDPGSPLAFRPAEAVLVRLLRDSASVWWDDRRTDSVETRAAILGAALAAALDTMEARHGPPDAGGWVWSGINRANINHLLGLPQLSARGIEVQGGPGTLNPIAGRGTHGPSWRMVVELGPELRAWATYPGGQSGNPLSPRYADRIPLWADGQLERLWTPVTRRDMPADSLIGRFTLVPVSP